MKKYRSIQPNFWRDPAIRNLPISTKLLAVYLLIGPHTDKRSHFSFLLSLVSKNLGEAIQSLAQALEALSEIGFLNYVQEADQVSGTLLQHFYHEKQLSIEHKSGKIISIY